VYWNDPYGMYAYGNATVSQRQEREYSEDLMQKNIGRVITVYLTFENNKQWNAKVVTGTLRAVGRDFIVVRDQQTGKDHMFLNINVDYIVFDRPAVLAVE
jgi:spore germination protein Q